MVAVVELRHVSKHFAGGGVPALCDVSLQVEEGEVLALLGPNGAGKTTALSLMLGLRRPSTGQVQVFGVDARDRRARLRRGAMLQDAGSPPALQVRELIDLFRAAYPAPLPTQTVLETIGLEDRARTLVGTLSTGQRQRLHFGLALCGDPAALILDEPTVGLDVDARRNLWSTIREFAQRGRSVILATHYLDEADELAHRAVVIHHGRVIAAGTPASLKAQLPGKRLSFRLGNERVQLVSHEPEAVLRALFARGLAIADLEVQGARLEEALVELLRAPPAVAPLRPPVEVAGV